MKRLYSAILLPALSFWGCNVSEPPPDVEWPVYLGDPTSSQFSSLDQINQSNVQQLEEVWRYPTGGASSQANTQIQCNPIIVNGILYGTTPDLRLFAVDATTGVEKWVFDPFQGRSNLSNYHVNRGVTYWSGEDGAPRILYTSQHWLLAVDAATGEAVGSFGDQGRIDLREGLAWATERASVIATSPGALYRHLLILGSRLSEGPDAAPGYIRAYDVRSGKIAWTFHTIPQPGEFGSETWPEDAWERVGGANAWSGMTVDHERGWVFAGTGSAAYDFYGGNRVGDNLFANSILALDAMTGERIWHYQTVRHDLWDRDLPAPPNLVQLTRDGQRMDAVAQITKSGHIFILDRDTGAPLFEVEEEPVPPSDLNGEVTAPTQRRPLRPPPFARQQLREVDLNDLDPEEHAYLKERFKGLRSGGQFVPPSRQGTVIFPGFDGGGEWGGAAYDSAKGMLYVNANEMPWILEMVETTPEPGRDWAGRGRFAYTKFCASCHGVDRRGDPRLNYPALNAEELTVEGITSILEHGQGAMPAFGWMGKPGLQAFVAYLLDLPDHEFEGPLPEFTEHRADVLYFHTGWNRFMTPSGYPAVKPPWGTLNAIDLNRGEIRWQVPLGEFEELSARGVPITGTENYGGPVVTAGGLIFIAASQDEKLRAFDADTGRQLWQVSLPAGGYATPATYQIEGRQYLVIAAGGGKMGTPSGETYVAFALPQS